MSITLRKASPIAVCALTEPSVEGKGVASTSRGRPSFYRRYVKRALDIGAALIAVPVVLPLVGGLALLVASEGGKPFYTQERIGKNGKVFRMWKLRSMVIDADARMEAYLAANPEARAEWNSTQKLKHDPRITRIGQFIRRTSLDELPQIWNVLRGDMSLVGPRPMMVSQEDLYHGKGYYELRPGVTGSWQTSERNNSTFEARVSFDDSYEANLSLGGDLRILARTVGVVLRGTGY